MNPIIWLLPGVVFGAAEFVLTKVISGRVLRGQTPIFLLVAKLASYGAVLLPVFFLLPRDSALRFGIGAGSGLLATGLAFVVYTILQEKR